MSERAQETRTEEEPEVAKSRPACLVSRNLSAKPLLSLDSGASYSLGNQEPGQNSVSTSIRETSAGQSPESSSEFSRVAKR